METFRAIALPVVVSIVISYLFFKLLKRPARWFLEWVVRKFVRPAPPSPMSRGLPSPARRIYDRLVVTGSGPAGFSVYFRSMARATNFVLTTGQLPHAGETIVEFDSPLHLEPGDEVYVEMTNRDNMNPVTLNVQLIGSSFDVPEGWPNQPGLV